MQLRCKGCGHLFEYTQVPPRFCSNCGKPLSTLASTRDNQATVAFAGPTPTISSEHPQSVGGYQVLRHLGGGGMGNVYEVEELGTGRKVALKLIRPEYADSTETVERFRREGRLASTILHPRCVFVLGADEHEGRPYIVMELMPGENLHDLIERNGPLEVRDAVAKILDVIDGLQEAHRCGIVHRDVKPSNCFLDSEARVKVGDFGLAKPFVSTEQLTRSGGFLGTILFASPEQIRNDRVNHQSDIYSACATLYFLLTGRAPYQDVDPAAALARAVTDPPPPMRRFRPEIPRTLDEVVLRGLARARRQRWQSLADLRLALLPFLDQPPALDTVGWRITAFLVDLLFFLPLLIVTEMLLGFQSGTNRFGSSLLSLCTTIGWGMIYFAVPEWWWGCTPGKWLCRLRVRQVDSADRPSLWRSALRTFWFFLFLDATPQILQTIPPGELDLSFLSMRVLAGVILAALLPPLMLGAGALLIGSTMRRNNGYRGVHELLSGTRVIRLPVLRERLLTPRIDGIAVPTTLPDLPERFGPFVLGGLIRQTENEVVAHGEDAMLNRPVWLWLHRGQPLTSSARRSVSRPTRPRWLSGGIQDGWYWEACVAAPGCLLVDLVAHYRRLSWVDTLHLLEQLTLELQQASADGTLPTQLSPEQLWIQPGGQVLLLDVPHRTPTPAETPLDLLRQTAALTLEGQVRPSALLSAPIRAPVPVHAGEVLTDLMNGRLSDLPAVQKALASAHDRPEQINQPSRVLQVSVAGLGMLLGLLWLFLLGPLLLLGSYWMCVAGAAAGELKKEQLVEQCQLIADPKDPRHLEERADWQNQMVEIDCDLQLLEIDRQATLASWTWLTRRGVETNEKFFREQFKESMLQMQNAEDPRDMPFDLLFEQGDSALSGPSAAAREPLEAPLILLQIYLLWPLVWAIWAGLSRGGIALWLSGIRLVGADGRPAARWRCAWRSLLVWVPLALLLLASLVIDLWRIAEARHGWSDEQIALWGALSWHLWWLAFLLLPAYVFIALRWPNRQPQDWLAGTFPVPR